MISRKSSADRHCKINKKSTTRMNSAKCQLLLNAKSSLNYLLSEKCICFSWNCLFNWFFILTFFSYINCAIIFFWTHDCKRRLRSYSKTSLFCLFSYFRRCESVRWTISMQCRSFCSFFLSFARREACCESSSSRLFALLWLIQALCLEYSAALWIDKFWRLNNSFYSISWKRWCARFENIANDNSARRRLETDLSTKTWARCTEFSEFCLKCHRVQTHCRTCIIWWRV